MLASSKTRLRRIARAAVASERAGACPAELHAAQCILATGWLQCAPGNNCFSIRSYPGESGRQLLGTHAWFDDRELRRFLALPARTAVLVTPVRQDGRGRRWYHVQDWFATFPTLADCFLRRAALLSSGPYAPLARAWIANRDLEALVRGVAAVDTPLPDYADRLLELIRDPALQAALAAARKEWPR